MSEWLNLKDKVAIVTGGASGIGHEVALSLKKNGVKTVIVDVSVQTGDEIYGMYCVKCDVTNRDNVYQMVDNIVEKYGKVDILINNAGVNFPRLIVDEKGEHPEYEVNEKDLEIMLAINVKGVFWCAQACIKDMIKRKEGVIINMSSESGKEGSQGASIYAATKGAVDSATRSWAKELGKYNIRVVAVAPGIIEATGLRNDAFKKALAYTRGVEDYSQLNTDYSKVIPLGRDGKLTEIADFVTYLASDRASYISGTTLNISAGKTRG